MPTTSSGLLPKVSRSKMPAALTLPTMLPGVAWVPELGCSEDCICLLLGFIAEWLGFTLAFLLCGAILLCLLTVVIRLAPGFDRAEREAA